MAENTKNRPRPSVAGMLRIAKPSPRAIPSCTMITGRKRPLSFSNVVSERVLTHQPTPVVTSRPRNIHRNAWVRKAVDSTAAGRTPSCDGDDGKPYWFIEIPLEAVASWWLVVQLGGEVLVVRPLRPLLVRTGVAPCASACSFALVRTHT